MNQKLIIYDVAIVGAGPAGMMAALQAGAAKGKEIILVERNSVSGKKILLTGKGRCNVTNIAGPEEFVKKFGKTGHFLKPAFYAFPSQELLKFFSENGLNLKTERQGRVFPETELARSVIEVFEHALQNNKISIIFNFRVKQISRQENYFLLSGQDKNICSKNIILATGGASYKATGSSGDGFHLAKSFGHTITPLQPGLVPLRVKEAWIKELSGLTLKNVRFACLVNAKTQFYSPIGEILCTHFGVSGPLILDLSAEIVSLHDAGNDILLLIDLKPGLTEPQLHARLLRDFEANGKMKIKNALKDLLPIKLIPVLLKLAQIPEDKTVSQISQKEREQLVKTIKGLPLHLKGPLPLEEAMVTNGGVSTAEINAKTMESKLIKGLYFAGEIIDGCAPSGGYNLQQAFSTGFLAGKNAGDGN